MAEFALIIDAVNAIKSKLSPFGECEATIRPIDDHYYKFVAIGKINVGDDETYAHSFKLRSLPMTVKDVENFSEWARRVFPVNTQPEV